MQLQNVVRILLRGSLRENHANSYGKKLLQDAAKAEKAGECMSRLTLDEREEEVIGINEEDERQEPQIQREKRSSRKAINYKEKDIKTKLRREEKE